MNRAWLLLAFLVAACGDSNERGAGHCTYQMGNPPGAAMAVDCRTAICNCHVSGTTGFNANCQPICMSTMNPYHCVTAPGTANQVLYTISGLSCNACASDAGANCQ